MSFASQTAGMVGKFGQSSFTSLSGLGSGVVAGAAKEGRKGGQIPPRPPKFFKTRIIEEETNEHPEEGNESTLTYSKFSTPTNNTDTKLVVAVRVRPMLSTEQDNVIDIDGSQVVVAAEKVFNFDEIFGPAVSQEELYERLIFSNVEKVLEGFNATVFSYGQTGTGKTFTMGTDIRGMNGEHEEQRGIVSRVLQHIFNSNKLDLMTVKISFYEINKGQVYDLINPSSSKVPLQVKEVQPVFKIVQLTEVEVNTVADAVNLLSKGSKIRSTEATCMNSSSSRSHAIFTISLVSRDSTDGSTVTRKINLVDLAGSENANRTQAVGIRFNEGVGINLGLSTLSRVVTALSKKAQHVPYRDSALTKVLKESLQSHCYITMVSCISPSSTDVQETISTLRFSDSAKQLRTKPVPSHLLNSCRDSVAKKKIHALRIPPTPLQVNNTIHTVTPSKSVKSGFKRALNSTIGTPGKRARGEVNGIIPATPVMRMMKPMTSTTSKYRGQNDGLCDLSGVSMIEPPSDMSSDSASTSAYTPATGKSTLPAEVSTFLSPLMRVVKETFKENMKQELNKMFQDLKADLTSSKSTLKTPVRMAKSRATSSPNRELARTRNSPKDMSEDSDLANTTIVLNDMAHSASEDIISGAGVTLPLQERPTLRAVINSASPELSNAGPTYDSPPSAQSRKLPSSPTIEEMERTLGINPDSPSAIMFTAPTRTVGAKNKNLPKRSSRRTTMMSSELNRTLKEIQNSDHGRRRSVRVAAQGKYYGSPGNEGNRHLLMEQENWKKVDPRRQASHNNKLLDILNTGNAKLLAGLPAVGPKTAFLIHQQRELHGYFRSLRELEDIPGISKSFFGKFCRVNQILIE